MKKSLLTLLLACASLHAMQNDLKLVPFDRGYEAEVARVYQENFSHYGETFSSALLKNYKIKIGLLDQKAMGVIIYKDVTTDGIRKRCIERFTVDKPYQRANRHPTDRHYGTELMKIFENQSGKEGVQVLYLDATGPDNKVAQNNISFYTSLNFKSEVYQHMTPLQAYARLGLTGLTMIKELEPQPSCWSRLGIKTSSLKNCFQSSFCKSSNQINPF